MRRRVIALLLALLVTTGLSACRSVGIEKQEADQITGTALLTATSARSVHVSGWIVDGVERGTIDMQLAAHHRASGVMSIEGAKVRLIRIGPKIFMNGSAAFWRKFADLSSGTADRQIVRFLAGKWFRAPAAGKDFASLANLTDMDKLFGGDAAGADMKKGAITTIAGVKAIEVDDNSDRIRIYVATTGKPYPLLIQVSQTGERFKFRFDHWNEEVMIKAPAGAVDLSKLK